MFSSPTLKQSQILKFLCSKEADGKTSPHLTVMTITQGLHKLGEVSDVETSSRNAVSMACKGLADGAYLERQKPLGGEFEYWLAPAGYRYGQEQGWLNGHSEIDPDAFHNEPERKSRTKPSNLGNWDGKQIPPEELEKPNEATTGSTTEEPPKAPKPQKKPARKKAKKRAKPAAKKARPSWEDKLDDIGRRLETMPLADPRP